MEESIINRLNAKFLREREAERSGESKPTVNVSAEPELEKLRAATAQSQMELLKLQKELMTQVAEIRAAQNAPTDPSQWAFEVQRDGANNMTRVIAKPVPKTVKG